MTTNSPYTIAYIGLGSNLHNPKRQLELAIEKIKKMPQTFISKTSSFYTTKALIPPERPNDIQPDYVNAVVEIKTGLSPFQLLDACGNIEKTMGRKRTIKRWEPRIIDLDILLYGKETIQTESLIIPHPEIQNRSFVLKPLREINKNY